LYIVAYIIFGVLITTRLFAKKRNKNSVIRSVIMYILIVFATIDLLLSLAGLIPQAYGTRYINCMFLLTFVRTLRVSWGQIMRVLYRSSTLFMIILVYWMFFMFLGFVLFSNNASSDFDGLASSFYSIFVVFTLSNYPQISYDYYKDSYYTFFFYVVYIMVGLYLFMNFLLAVIFNNYKKLISEEN
jgi:hypothetical protein